MKMKNAVGDELTAFENVPQTNVAP